MQETCDVVSEERHRREGVCTRFMMQTDGGVKRFNGCPDFLTDLFQDASC